MKLFPVFAVAISLLSTPVFAGNDSSSAPCNLRDSSSTCEIHLTVKQLNIIDGAFENAALAHAVWGPVWDDISNQLLAQQPKKDEKSNR